MSNKIFSEEGEDFQFQFKKTLENIKLEPISPKKIKEKSDAEQTIEVNKSESSEKRQKLNNGKVKKRLRKLVTEEQQEKTVEKHQLNRSYYFNRFKIFGLIISIFIVIFAIYSDNIRNELIKNYQNQYNILVHGKIDYCSQKFDYKNISISFKNKLIGQEVATQEMFEIFNKHRDFTSIGILGNTGVGKTYTSSLIVDQFQWSENIHFYIWSEQSGNEQIKNLIKYIDKFSNCGHNILFIDDLTYDDRNYIQSINEIIKMKSKTNNFNIIIFYIFNLNKTIKITQSHIDTLKLLVNISIIEYRDLNNNDILKCIDLVSKMLNFPLTSIQKSDVVTSLFGTQTGCKNVYAKVLLYANKQ